MTTSLNTASAVDTPKTIRAAINERNLFGTMGQWFASTYSFLGETMQNSRRAGATFVSYDVQHHAHGGVDLVISDDGAGIDDFQMLLQLAESGWSDESVLLTEKPFGMGLFSVFYACERVTFSSKGQTVTVGVSSFSVQ